ncbi:MAG: hypothetical protein K6U74_17915, partial [Firmicutes bacterium]|nr:hypothetical protein [Bacillota bacterium]
QRISLVLNNGNQVVIQPGLTLIGTRPLPAGTPLVAVRRIEYQIDAENFLVRRVNGTVTDRVAIDPTATRFQYTVGTSVQNALTPSDLDNLRFVNVSLRLVRTAAVPGGRRVSITGSAVERIAPLNLRGF